MHWILSHPLTIQDFINFTAHWSKKHGFRFLRVPYGIFAGKLLSKLGKGFLLVFFSLFFCAFINPVSKSSISVLYNL